MRREVLALLLDDVDTRPEAGGEGTPALLPRPTMLVRREDGQMTVEALGLHSAFRNHRPTTTRVFRRGKPIIDPVTSEIMGYEMEEVRFSQSVAS